MYFYIIITIIDIAHHVHMSYFLGFYCIPYSCPCFIYMITITSWQYHRSSINGLYNDWNHNLFMDSKDTVRSWVLMLLRYKNRPYSKMNKSTKQKKKKKNLQLFWSFMMKGELLIRTPSLESEYKCKIPSTSV